MFAPRYFASRYWTLYYFAQRRESVAPTGATLVEVSPIGALAEVSPTATLAEQPQPVATLADISPTATLIRESI